MPDQFPNLAATKTAARRASSWMVWLFMTGWLAAVVLCLVWYWIDARKLREVVMEREVARVRLYGNGMSLRLTPVIGDLHLLASSEPMRDFLVAPRDADLRRLEVIASEFARQRPDYDQLRYLDENGMERVRVNQGGQIVAPDRLQDKSGHDYFQSAMRQPPGRVALSALNLNVEQGRIEQPLKPMLRFSIPVFDDGGRRRGAWIINYRAESIIEGLTGVIPRHSRLRMLNADGYWLKADDDTREWGFQITEHAGHRLSLTDPPLWARLSSQEQGQLLHQGGLFTWRRIDPVLATGRPSGGIDATDAYWIAASELTPAELDGEFAMLRDTFFTLGFFLAAAFAGSGWLLRTRIRTQGELEFSRDMLALMFENAPDANLLVDQAGNIVRANAKTEVMFGWPKSELIDRDLAILLPERFRQRHAGHLKAYFANPSPRAMGAGLELSGLRKDGSEFPLDIMLSPMRTTRGMRVLAVIRDITERKAAEQAIQRLNKDLVRQNARLAATNGELEAFSYSVSHDLRAPLRHIGGFADILSRHAADRLDETGQRHLKVITDSTVRMGQLIDDLLQFSRYGRTQLSIGDVSLDALVAESRLRLAQTYPHRDIVWNISPLPVVRGDTALIRQVVANLLDNAVKYTGKQSRAVIDILPAHGEGDEAGMTVRDNGAGFDMRYVEKLFGVFQRLHSSHEFEGSGVGLANVRRILTRHGGRIWAEGRVNGGATFTFVLPADVCPPDEPSSSSQS